MGEAGWGGMRWDEWDGTGRVGWRMCALARFLFTA